MKSITYTRKGFVVTLDENGKSFSIHTSGIVPKKIKEQVAELENSVPRPTFQFAVSILNSILK